MASSRQSYSNISTNAQLDSEKPHHQAQFAPQLKLDNHQYENNHMTSITMNQANAQSSIQTPFTNSIYNNFMAKYGGGSYDFVGFDQASMVSPNIPATIVDQSTSFPVLRDHQRQSSVLAGMRPPSTLNSFPSYPLHGRDPFSISTVKVSAATILSPSSGPARRSVQLSDNNITSDLAESSKAIKGKGKEVSSSSGQDHPRKSDSKTLRRLLQNREASRKNRLRRKAYIQQLESSNTILTELEQELQKAKAQGVYLGGADGVLGPYQGVPLGVGYVSSEAAAFNMEYTKWLDEHRHRVGMLQVEIKQRCSENEIQFAVDNIIWHFDNLMHQKSMIVRADVFHIMSGMWKSPAERCFLWIGGFRPSELIKIIAAHVKPLTEQQILRIMQLRNVMLQTEKNLSQDLLQLEQSVSGVDVSRNSNSVNDMGQMEAGIKISEFVRIVDLADHQRREAFHHVLGLMTTHQASMSLIAISEYSHRLQYLSDLWASRVRQP